MLWLLFLLLFPAFSYAQTSVAEVECPFPTHSSCFDTTDQNRDGLDTSTSPAVAFVTDGATGWNAHLEDCAVVGPYSTVADASDVLGSGNVVEKAGSTDWNNGEISCRFSGVTPGTYYATLLLRNDGGSKSIWVSHNDGLGATFQNEHLARVPQINPYGWFVVNTTGTPRAFTLGADGTIRIKSEDLFRFACIYMDTDLTKVGTAPTCPGNTGDLQADYIVLEKGAEVTPIAYNSAAFTHANVMQFTGLENPASPAVCGGTLTVKAIWENTGTDRMFWSIQCADSDDETVTTTNDQAALLTTSQDRFNFRWRNDLEFSEGTGLYGFVANLFPVYSDWTHDSGGTRDLATNLNMTVVKNINSGSNWNLFVAHDLPGMSSNTVGICNAVIQDKDAGVSTVSKFFHGDSITLLTDYGRCLWSSDTVPASGGGGDTTAPVVTAFAVPLAQITGTAAQGSATTGEGGTCRFHVGINSGVYTIASPGSGSSAAHCQETITGLTPSLTYFGVMKVTDNAGNVGTSNEVSFSTASIATASHYVSPAGTGDCRTVSTPCTLNNVWTTASGSHRNVGPGSIIQLADGVHTNGILPPPNLNGTSTNKILIRAATDGGARIQVSSGRAILLHDNDHFIIEGINAVTTSTVDGVIQIGGGADNNTFRRMCAWKPLTTAGDSDGAIWVVGGTGGNTGNLLEDVCGFGESRSIFGNQQNGNNLTIRRAFGMFSKSTQVGQGGKTVFTNGYNSTGGTFENVIAAWNTVAIGDQPQAMLRFGPLTTLPDACRNARYLGSIAFIRSTDVAASWNGQMGSSDDADCIEARDVVLYIAPNTHTNLVPMHMLNSVQAGTGVDKELTNITLVNTAAASVIQSNWQQTNIWSYANQAAMAISASPWQTTTGDGARVCFRYLNGVRTSTPLWPWPMNARIIAAMATAGITAVDVTATMETLLGTIPPECRDDGGGGTLPPPTPPILGAVNEFCHTTGTDPGATVLTTASAWQTAIQAAAPGAKFLLGAGTYDPTNYLTMPNGTSGNPISVFANNCASVTIRNVQVKSFNTFAGINFESTGTETRHAIFVSPTTTDGTLWAEGSIIRNSTITTSGATTAGKAGIRITGDVKDLTITGIICTPNSTSTQTSGDGNTCIFIRKNTGGRPATNIQLTNAHILGPSGNGDNFQVGGPSGGAADGEGDMSGTTNLIQDVWFSRCTDENCVDHKGFHDPSSKLVVRRAYFDGVGAGGGCALLHSNTATNSQVEILDSVFSNCIVRALVLGAVNSEGARDQTDPFSSRNNWKFTVRNVTFVQPSAEYIKLEVNSAIVDGITTNGGDFQFSTGYTVSGLTFTNNSISNATFTGSFTGLTCTGNTFVNTTPMAGCK